MCHNILPLNTLNTTTGNNLNTIRGEQIEKVFGQVEFTSILIVLVSKATIILVMDAIYYILVDNCFVDYKSLHKGQINSFTTKLIFRCTIFH